MSEAPTGFRPGLEGVPATQSAISNIDGQQGILSYRGYRIEDLAAHSTFLETAYLLIWGELPSAEGLREFQHDVQMHRRVSFRIRDMLKCFPSGGTRWMPCSRALHRWGSFIPTARWMTRTTSAAP